MQNYTLSYMSVDIKYNLRNINNFIFLHLDISYLFKIKKS